MRKLYIGLALIFMLGFLLLPSALAAGQPPVGECLDGFHIHDFHDPGMHEHGHHVGLDKDLNGNGMICAKHLSSGKHVHMDDVVQGS